MECPSGGVCVDSAILDGGNFGCCPRVNHTVRVCIKEGQVECLLGHHSPRSTIGIRDQAIWITGEICCPGASPDHSGCIGPAVCADHAEVREQAEAPQDASCDDQHRQPNEKPCHGSRNSSSLALDRHGW